MNCQNCGHKLRPFLKQVQMLDTGDIYEVECVECRKYSYVDKEIYRHITLDFEMPTIQPINLKLPKDLNVIFVSMRRCGISWVIRELSKFHEKMFGSKIPFTPKNAEISSTIATLDGYPLPIAWNNCYDVIPQELLDRTDPEGKQYDKIVVIHRALETLINVNKITMAREGLNEQHIEKLLSKLPEEYNAVYGNRIDDPRILYLDLWDLNQYPDACFNELMDFLNFPTHNRPPVVAVKGLPFLQLIEAYSSVWTKGFELTGMLGRVKGLFEMSYDGLLSYLAEDLMSRNQEITLENILIIGPKIHKGCHFSENIYKVFKAKGFNVELLPLETLGWGTKACETYRRREKVYLVSDALKEASITPELVVFDEPAWLFYNDTNIPAFYVHREYKRSPTVVNPDIALFWHQGVIASFKGVRGHPYWSNKVKDMRVLEIAVDPLRFTPKEKTIHGVSCLAGRESMEDCLKMHESNATPLLTRTMKEIKEFRELGMDWIMGEHGRLTDEKFRELLPCCESCWISLPLGQHVSRRMLEAMMCKTVCIIKIENRAHEKVLESMGFYADEHYIKIMEMKDMVDIDKEWDYSKFSKMVENAYQVVMERHTYLVRANQLIELYKEFKANSKVVLVE